DVIEAPRVRLKAVHGHRALSVFALGATALVRVRTAVVVRLLWRDRRPPPERCRRAGASYVLALDLREQAVGLAGLPRQPRHIDFRVVPIDVDHGVVTTAPPEIRGFVAVAAAGGDARVPLVEGHGVSAHCEWCWD